MASPRSTFLSSILVAGIALMAVGSLNAAEKRAAGAAESAPLLAHFAEDVRALTPIGARPETELGFCRGTVSRVVYTVAAGQDERTAFHRAALAKYGAPVAAEADGAPVPALVYRKDAVTLTVAARDGRMVVVLRDEHACGTRQS